MATLMATLMATRSRHDGRRMRACQFDAGRALYFGNGELIGFTLGSPTTTLH
jgi:hypothetical protein